METNSFVRIFDMHVIVLENINKILPLLCFSSRLISSIDGMIDRLLYTSVTNFFQNRVQDKELFAYMYYVEYCRRRRSSIIIVIVGHPFANDVARASSSRSVQLVTTNYRFRLFFLSSVPHLSHLLCKWVSEECVYARMQSQ